MIGMPQSMIAIHEGSKYMPIESPTILCQKNDKTSNTAVMQSFVISHFVEAKKPLPLCSLEQHEQAIKNLLTPPPCRGGITVYILLPENEYVNGLRQKNKTA